MSDYHYLIGANDALRASHNMESAADQMRRAVDDMGNHVEVMRRALEDHSPDVGNMVAVLASNLYPACLQGKSGPHAKHDAVIESVELAKHIMQESNK